MNPSKPKALLRSQLLSYFLSGVLLVLLSLALYKLKLKESQVQLFVYVIYGAACLAGGFLAGKIIRSRRFFWGMLSGLIYFLILFVLSFFAGHGAVSDLSHTAAVMACCLAGGTLGGMLS